MQREVLYDLVNGLEDGHISLLYPLALSELFRRELLHYICFVERPFNLKEKLLGCASFVRQILSRRIVHPLRPPARR